MQEAASCDCRWHLAKTGFAALVAACYHVRNHCITLFISLKIQKKDPAKSRVKNRD